MKQSLKSKRTKEKLLASARELINERGFDHVSVQDITEHAGVAKGTFYHYFNVKEDVVRDLCFASYDEVFKKALHMDTNIVDRMSFFIVSLCREAEFSGLSLCRQWLRGILDPDSKEKQDPSTSASTSLKRSGETISALLQSGIDRGELSPKTPVLLLVKFILAHIYGIFSIWCMMNGDIDLMQEAKLNISADVENLLSPYLVKQ